jgi:hypothetical protein
MLLTPSHEKQHEYLEQNVGERHTLAQHAVTRIQMDEFRLGNFSWRFCPTTLFVTKYLKKRFVEPNKPNNKQHKQYIRRVEEQNISLFKNPDNKVTNFCILILCVIELLSEGCIYSETYTKELLN